MLHTVRWLIEMYLIQTVNVSNNRIMLIYHVKDKKIFHNIQSLSRYIWVFLFFLVAVLSVKYNNGLIFVGCLFFAWFIAYFIVGYLITNEPIDTDREIQ